MTKNLRLALITLSIISIAVSFWLFSRFTVDDAFITWRYGSNLINFGIWNYNPSLSDLTQAYTNPIYALLSIIPAYFKVDVVLFFKLFSLILLISFFAYFYTKTKSLLMTLMAYAVPATFIHAFSGLETFLFVALMVLLFISMDENKPFLSVLVAAVLMLTRPEAWLLVLLVPIYFLIQNRLDNFNSFEDFKALPKKILSISSYRGSYKKSTSILIILSIFLTLYFIFHKLHFGFALPNTFYIKSGSNFSITYFTIILTTIIPLLLLSLSKRLALLILFGGFYLVIGFQYSNSSLGMNYVERFLFHILMPIYFILVYVASKNDSIIIFVSDEGEKFNFKIRSNQYINIVAFILLLFITMKTVGQGGLAHIANYYPRALDSHAAFGKVLNELKKTKGIDSFSLGDAGMAAYHSQLNALDNIGLGSTILSQNGMNKNLIELYNPKVVAFHARPDGIRINDHNQKILKDWVDEKNFVNVCDFYWLPDYTLKIYSKELHSELIQACEYSKEMNDKKNIEYAKSSLKKNPISYWHD